MEHSKAYYVTRSVVRGVVYMAMAAAGALAIYAFILCTWAVFG